MRSTRPIDACIKIHRKLLVPGGRERWWGEPGTQFNLTRYNTGADQRDDPGRPNRYYGRRVKGYEEKTVIRRLRISQIKHRQAAGSRRQENTSDQSAVR